MKARFGHKQASNIPLYDRSLCGEARLSRVLLRAPASLAEELGLCSRQHQRTSPSQHSRGPLVDAKPFAVTGNWPASMPARL